MTAKTDEAQRDLPEPTRRTRRGEEVDTLTFLDTPRLTLRPLQPEDADAFNHVFGDPEVMTYGDGVKPPQWVAAWIGRRIDEFEQGGGLATWAVVEKSSGVAAGYCGLGRSPERCAADETEIGFRLRRSHWGRGLATEAALAVRDHALATLDLAKLIAIIDPANTPSLRVARKIGMCYKRDLMLEGYDHPDHVYAIARRPE